MAFVRRWRVVLGILWWIIPLGKFVRTLFELGGDTEFAATHSVWLVKMIEAVGKIPDLLTLPSIIVGLVLIWWDVRRKTARSEAGHAENRNASVNYPATKLGWLKPDWVYLHEAAKNLYGGLGKSYLRSVIDERCKQEDEVLDIVGGIILRYTVAFGLRPPSNKWEKIDKEELSSMRLSGGSLTLQPLSQDRSIGYYSMLAIEKSELDKAKLEIERIKDNPLLRL